MPSMEELMCAALTADEVRKAAALRVLRGEAVAVDPDVETRRPTSGPLLINMGQAAEFLGVSRGTLWRIIDAGRLEKVELYANCHRLRREDVEALVDRRPSRTPVCPSPGRANPPGEPLSKLPTDHPEESQTTSKTNEKDL